MGRNYKPKNPVPEFVSQHRGQFRMPTDTDDSGAPKRVRRCRELLFEEFLNLFRIFRAQQFHDFNLRVTCASVLRFT